MDDFDDVEGDGLDGDPFGDDCDMDGEFDGPDEVGDDPESDFFVEPDFVDDQAEEGPDGDGFTAKDGFFIGSIAGQFYEESQDERRRRLINKKDKD
jgi:hypothetical protein